MMDLEIMPTLNDVISFYGTVPGYYVIQGDIIILEFFGATNKWTYFHEKLRIQDGKLIVLQAVGYSNEDLIFASPYKKHCLGSMKNKPDW
jgi:hypothetical protein